MCLISGHLTLSTGPGKKLLLTWQPRSPRVDGLREPENEVARPGQESRCLLELNLGSDTSSPLPYSLGHTGHPWPSVGGNYTRCEYGRWGSSGPPWRMVRNATHHYWTVETLNSGLDDP